ncbi:MAG: glycoside hydrolase family 2 protein, partial [Clostridia bacterium]|nr:glycoside hydrolase family 2 protein [Clostridia bacterium]
MADRKMMDTDWLYHYGDAADAGFMGYDDRGWRHVTLPHDWAVEYPFDKAHSSGTGYLPGGTAWYRRHFSLPEDIGEKDVHIAFEGVYGRARVWINSNYLGAHAYKYTSFSMDLTPFAKPGENVIAVRVEHDETADSRWYTGSGICRHVYLETAPKGGFVRDSLFVRTGRLSEDGAALTVDYETGGMKDITFRLIDDEGSIAAETHADTPRGTVVLSVPDPHPWSPDDPYLYTLSCTAASGNDVDTETIPAGIRVFSFDPDKGFFLNGTGMKIKGVCVHHDAGCLGAAVPESVWERRLRKLKEAGCNALRTAHNPPDPGLLDLCDRMGFLVMDEAFDEWEGIKNKWWQGHNVYPPRHYGYGEDFPEWHVRDLESMVLRDRNHPSIVIWSIGNEIDYPNDPYVTPLFDEVLGNNDAGKPAAERVYDPRKPDAGRLAVIAKELTGIVHRLDSTRPVLSALSFPELSNLTGFADALDIVGYNYREHFYKADHAAYPGRVLLGSENSHASAAWYAVRDNAFISAQFLWTGIDFL